jgi:hypothetical protein
MWAGTRGGFVDEERTRTTLDRVKYCAGLAVCALFGWTAFVRGERIWLLGGVDLGFHELGHMLAMPVAARPFVAFAGTLVQLAVPFGLAAYFFFVRRDRFATLLMLAWEGTTMQSSSVYIADAPYQALPLLGGPGGHDWAYLLGPEVLDMLGASRWIAGTVWMLGLLTLLVAVALGVWGLAGPYVASERAKVERARLATLPRREPRTRPPAPTVPDDPAKG